MFKDLFKRNYKLIIPLLFFVVGYCSAFAIEFILSFLKNVEYDWITIGAVASGFGSIVVIPFTILWNIRCANKEKEASARATLQEILILANHNASITLSLIIGVAKECCKNDAFVLQKFMCNAGDVINVNIDKLTRLEESKIVFIQDVVKVVADLRWIQGAMIEFNAQLDTLRLSEPRDRLEVHKSCIAMLHYVLDKSVDIIIDFKKVYESAINEFSKYGISLKADLDTMEKLKREAIESAFTLKHAVPSKYHLFSQNGFPQIAHTEDALYITYSHSEVLCLRFEHLLNERIKNNIIIKNKVYGNEFAGHLQAIIDHFLATHAVRILRQSLRECPQEEQRAEDATHTEAS